MVTSKALAQIERDLQTVGWAVASWKRSGFAEAIHGIGAHLGVPELDREGRPHISLLKPMTRQRAKPFSPSGRNGLRGFPWHMDGAHLARPPRFIIFGCLAAGKKAARTQILDTKGPNIAADRGIRSEPFRVRSGGASFYATMAALGGRFIRHDPGCMTPMTPQGHQLQRDLERRPASYTMVWQKGAALIIDNWRCLHRRSDASGDRYRCLARLYVHERTP